MKIIETNPVGGYKFYSNDIRFMNEMSKEMVDLLIKPFSVLHNVIILHGCNISVSAGNTTVSDGMVIFNGELMRFDAQTFVTPSGSNKAYWVFQNVVLTSRNYEAGNLVDVYQENVAKVEVGAVVPGNSVVVSATKRYWEVVNDQVVHPAPFEYYFEEDVSDFDNHLLSVGQGFPAQFKLLKANKTTLFELGETGTAGQREIVTIQGPNIMGTIVSIKFNKNIFSPLQYNITLNSTNTNTRPKLIQQGVTGDDMPLTLNVGAIYSFMWTQKGWQLME